MGELWPEWGVSLALPGLSVAWAPQHSTLRTNTSRAEPHIKNQGNSAIPLVENKYVIIKGDCRRFKVICVSGFPHLYIGQEVWCINDYSGERSTWSADRSECSERCEGDIEQSSPNNRESRVHWNSQRREWPHLLWHLSHFALYQ